MSKVAAYKNRRAQEEVIEAIRTRRKKYVTKVNGKNYIVFPDVFSPHMVLDTPWYAKHLPSQKNKRVLEVGAGSGVLAITAAHQGAVHVTASDINPHAVANTKANVKRHKLTSVVKVVRSDVYKNIPKGERFDTIMWNVPWGDFGRGERLNWIQRAFYDPGYKLLKRFVAGAPKYLRPGGTLLVGFSTSVGSGPTLKRLFKDAGFTFKVGSKNRHGFAVGHPAGPIYIEWFVARLKK